MWCNASIWDTHWQNTFLELFQEMCIQIKISQLNQKCCQFDLWYMYFQFHHLKLVIWPVLELVQNICVTKLVNMVSLLYFNALGYGITLLYLGLDSTIYKHTTWFYMVLPCTTGLLTKSIFWVAINWNVIHKKVQFCKFAIY